MEPTYFIYKRDDTPNAIIKFDGVDYWWLGAGEQDAKYLAWLAEGNEPEEWTDGN